MHANFISLPIFSSGTLYHCVDRSGLGLSVSITKIVPTYKASNQPKCKHSFTGTLTRGETRLCDVDKATSHTAHCWYFMLHNMAFSRMSYHWINTICNLSVCLLVLMILHLIYIHSLSSSNIGYLQVHLLEITPVASRAQQLRVLMP